jgi:hypothetical protein
MNLKIRVTHVRKIGESAYKRGKRGKQFSGSSISVNYSPAMPIISVQEEEPAKEDGRGFR